MQSATDTVRWIHDPDAIAKNYAKTWFLPDFFSIMVSGFDFVTLNSMQICGPETEALAAELAASPTDGSDVSTLRVLRIIRVARLVKLVRLVRSSRIMKRFESRAAINYGHLALFKCLVGLIISAHCETRAPTHCASLAHQHGASHSYTQAHATRRPCRFLSPTMRSGRVGEWLRASHPLALCAQGLHASGD